MDFILEELPESAEAAVEYLRGRESCDIDAYELCVELIHGVDEEVDEVPI